MDLPLYRCHKYVRAAKIRQILLADDDAVLRVEGPQGADLDIVVGPTWMIKHEPVVGGYYVRYEDGYSSFSPADAFEAGYTQV